MTLKIKVFLVKYQIILFFVFSYLISWAIWIPQSLSYLGICEVYIPSESPINLLTVWGPGLAAILLVILMAGKIGLRKLFSPIKRWRVAIHWYIFVLFLPAVVQLVSHGLYILIGRSSKLIPALSELGPDYATMLPLLVIFVIPNALGEEIGWRGFALPRLQKKYNALISSIIVGIFWSIWHIPTWTAQGFLGLTLVNLIINIILYSILFAWIFNNSNKSLLLVWIFHITIAVTGYFLGSPTLTDSILLLLVVIIIVALSGPKNLSKKHKIKVV